ncbi:MAG TPA: hypothetical protein VFJ47_01655 [Terriglobales bacterium]|nr:hypothetical protein [Terriglobales bacterium]
MPRSVRNILPLLLTVALCTPLWAGDAAPASGNTAAAGYDSLTSSTIKSEGDATLRSGLVGLLVSKGLITSNEANSLLSGPASEVTANLLKLLKDKGLITNADLAQVTRTAMPASAAAPISAIPASTPAAAVSAIIETPQSSAAQSTTNPAAAGPAVIPAVAPLRVLPIDVPKQSGMIPDIKLGSGANIKLYGFYKASAVSDTASSGGATFGSQDWPLPLLIGGDTGPTSDPQVHIKARSFRVGMQTEWVPKGSDFTITGRVEADFEGDYTDVNNRNISAVRSNQFSLRLAWVRLDHKLGTLPWFAEFGQDWTIFGSSTLPNLFETTGLGVGMGSLYERIPQFRTGIQFPAGDVKIQPEFAITMPVASSSALTADQRLRFGDRAGAESNQPGLESRVVFQFPLSHNWKGVVPAQLIFSGHWGRINEIIPHASQTLPVAQTCLVLPCTIDPFSVFTAPGTPNVGFNNTVSISGASNCAEPTGICNLGQIFRHGAQVGNKQNGYSGEIQLPTPWVTLAAKFYRGEDLRFFFAGQVNDVFSQLGTLKAVAENTAISFSGRQIGFGCAGGAAGATPNTFVCPGTPVLPAKLQPVAGSGGFIELSFPLSRIFNANPEGHNSGWVLHTEYSTDRANYLDAQHGNHLGRTDLDTVSLTYRLNKWVTFVHEASYIVTFTANNHEPTGAILVEKLPFAGVPTRQAHDWRNEFGPIFTF